ncbi:MAG: DUF3747 domain-containing protein [Synechococcaceae cyanobacterium]|nr:DUF3747 domain-containing protein [Synechococcaceae cyanobacterium]
MKRTYLALAGVALAGAAVPAGLAPLGRAAGVFQSQPVDASRFAVLARPGENGGWNLVVLEQIGPTPLCWRTRADGLVEPGGDRPAPAGACSRYVDGNGYSVRVGSQEPAGAYELRLEQQGDELQLQAIAAAHDGRVLVVGRAPVATTDGQALVPLELESGWELRRRAVGQRSLNHLYFFSAGDGRPAGPTAAEADPTGEAAAASGEDAAAEDAPLAVLPAAPPAPLPPLPAGGAADPGRSSLGGVRGPFLAMGRGRQGVLRQRPGNPGTSALDRALQGLGSSTPARGSSSGGSSRLERALGTTDGGSAVADSTPGRAIPLTVIPFGE